MAENAKSISIIRTILSVVFGLLLVLFIFCCIFAKAQTDKSFRAFGATFLVKNDIDECNLPNGSLVFIKSGEAKANSIVAYEHSNSIRLAEYSYVPGNAKIIGVATSYIVVLGSICDFFYNSALAFGAFFVLLTALLVFLLTYGRGGSRLRLQTRKRISIQTLWTVLTNSYVIGFIKGGIYQGKLKQLCLPGLNCYSCPGALGACPIGAMQAALTQRSGNKPTNYFPFYAVGAVMLFGAICGRLVCGFLCPFGWAQELLHKIPAGKLKINTFKGDKALRYLKYAVLVVFVFAMPLFITNAFPWFCKLICPSGMLFGGIPLLSVNEGLRSAAGGFTILKLSILAVIIIASIIIYRPFCKYICPLGAIYSLLNKASLYRAYVNENACTHCKRCASVCKMGVDITKTPNAPECIRCGDCKAACPSNAICFSFASKEKKEKKANRTPKIHFTKKPIHTDSTK